MSSVNIDSILLKCKPVINQEVDNVLNNELEDLVEKYIEIFRSTLASSGVPDAIEKLGSMLHWNDFDVSPSAAINDGGSWYKRSTISATLSFGGDLRRESLSPLSNGIENILLLFNYGYAYNPARMKIRGTWHGIENVGARLERDGLFFIEEANNLAMQQIEGLRRATKIK